MSSIRAVVCVKEVQGEPNPFDACAVECALRLTDDVTVVSMGRPSARDMLLRLTRLGCRAVLLSDPALAGADTLATAYGLSLAVKRLNPDLILCGRQSIDGDTAQTGPALATMLGVPFAANVMELSPDENGVHAVTRSGSAELPYPSLITVERINTLRFPRLSSRLGEVEVWSAADIGADTARCGSAGSPTRVLRTFESAAGQRKCKYIPLSELSAVIRNARAARRIGECCAESARKLPLVWCVGGEVADAARRVANEVRIIDRTAPEKIARLIRDEKPDFVLWPADLWGRSAAPVAQAILQTGLCADCTALETDGHDLFMYRPAFGGTLTAKIQCVTKPVMATVRIADNNAGDLIVSCGKGAAGCLEQIRSLTAALGGESGASRGLVDAGLAKYEQQVGLTGRSVGCAVYLAVGISGAVHHTCALDRVGTVIAVNPDPHARVFDYADFGVIASSEELVRSGISG